MKELQNEERTKFDAAFHSTKVLAVDDDRTALFMLEHQLIELGYEPTCAGSGTEALEILANRASEFGAIILDRQMPDMNGLEVVAAMRDDPMLTLLPIVMLTGSDSQAEMQEGLDAGVFYYLAKPAKIGLLKSVLSAARRQGIQNRAMMDGGSEVSGFDLLNAARFGCRTIKEAEVLSGFLANFFPDPQRALFGIGAILVNAVEHGICKIGFELKAQLLASGDLAGEIERRLSTTQSEVGMVEVSIARKADGIYLVVRDPGQGFNWREFTTIDQSRAATTNGRGIAQAKAMSFDKLVYQDPGNKVVAFVSNQPELIW